MKTLFLAAASLLTISTFSIPAWAIQTNPQIRQCYQLHGEFVVVDTQDDQVGLCKLDSAYIGSLDLLTFIAKEAFPISIYAYQKGVTSCDPMGTSRTVKTLEGQELRVCFFADGSLIEMTTLQNGMESEQNAKLNEALAQ